MRVDVVDPDAVLKGSKIWQGDWLDQRAGTCGTDKEGLEEMYRERSLLERPVLPEDIAEAAYFLASDLSAKRHPLRAVPGAGEPRGIFDKLDDCGVIHRLTRATPAGIAPHTVGRPARRRPRQQGRGGGPEFRRDDDLDTGSIDPYRLLLVFDELVEAEKDPGLAPMHMLDQSHNVTDPIESLMVSATEVQRAYAQALLVDRAALEGFQNGNDARLSAPPLPGPPSFTSEKTPGGMAQSTMACATASATMARCRGGPRRRPGIRRPEPTPCRPRHREGERKLDAPNTATGPIGCCIKRRSGRGTGRARPGSCGCRGERRRWPRGRPERACRWRKR